MKNTCWMVRDDVHSLTIIIIYLRIAAHCVVSTILYYHWFKMLRKKSGFFFMTNQSCSNDCFHSLKTRHESHSGRQISKRNKLIFFLLNYKVIYTKPMYSENVKIYFNCQTMIVISFITMNMLCLWKIDYAFIADILSALNAS